MNRYTALILWLASAGVGASDCQPQLPADAKPACEESAVADANLNTTYQRILRQLDREDASQAKASLVRAQRLWVKFRDADCGAVFDYNAPGGVRFAEMFRCETRHTESRMNELTRYAPQH